MSGINYVSQPIMRGPVHTMNVRLYKVNFSKKYNIVDEKCLNNLI